MAVDVKNIVKTMPNKNNLHGLVFSSNNAQIIPTEIYKKYRNIGNFKRNFLIGDGMIQFITSIRS
jgi:hypothetical protein